jgi:hypothetical protein
MYHTCFVHVVMPFYIHICKCCSLLLLRKSSHKTTLQTRSPSQIPIISRNIKWEQEHEDELVQILKKLQEEGVILPYGKHGHHITKKLNKRLRGDTVYTMKQVKGKIKLLKELYVDFLDFVHDKTGTVVGRMMI